MGDVASRHGPDGRLRIYIDGALHLVFSTIRLAGLQSWTTSHARTPAGYAIEVTPWEGAAITAEYDDPRLWRAVLAEIDAAMGPGPCGPGPGKRETARRDGSGEERDLHAM